MASERLLAMAGRACIGCAPRIAEQLRRFTVHGDRIALSLAMSCAQIDEGQAIEREAAMRFLVPRCAQLRADELVIDAWWFVAGHHRWFRLRHPLPAIRVLDDKNTRRLTAGADAGELLEHELARPQARKLGAFAPREVFRG